MTARTARYRHGLVVLLALAVGGCQAIRSYARDLMDPRESAAVTVPVRVGVALFVLPPAIVWLPVSSVVLLVLHDETAVWFALAPGLILGGPFVLLLGAPGYALTDRPPRGDDDVARPGSATGTTAAAVTSTR